MPTSSRLASFKKLWWHLTPRRRFQFVLILGLMILTSCAEVVSIGSMLPFLSVLTSPENIFQYSFVKNLANFLNLERPTQLLLPLTIVFSGAAIASGIMRLLLLWASTRLSFAAGADISTTIYKKTLLQPYAVHISRNSGEVINGILGKTSETVTCITSALTIIASTVILTGILFTLLAINPVIALSAFGGFGLMYSIIVKLTAHRLVENSKQIAKASTTVIKSLQDGLGGIRDVLIDGTQATYVNFYKEADSLLKKAHANNQLIGGSPRYAIEALGMVLIASLAFSMTNSSEGIDKALPILGVLAMGAQRLLPILQSLYASWSGIQGSHASFVDTLALLDQPIPSDVDFREKVPSIVFRHSLVLKEVSFRYAPDLPETLKDVSLSIKKGSRVGFIGTTGSGKSTLLDCIMGLLEPTEGRIEIDGVPITKNNFRTWQRHIAHVPQVIYLADTTIMENIAFGIAKDEINIEKVIQAAKQAQLEQVIQGWPNKFQTIVGERGIRLSGGQRQRIGIARALYKDADVIVFDEATSSLDSETEQAVIQSISYLSKDLTILIIAHRHSTIADCSEVFRLEHGAITKVATSSFS